MPATTRRSRIHSRKTVSSARRRRMSIETLEKRQLLAASIDAGGLDVELKRVGDMIQIVEVDSVAPMIWELEAGNVQDGQIEINAATFRVGSDVDLSGNGLLVSAESIFVLNGRLFNGGEVFLSAVKQPDLIDSVLSDAVLQGLIATESQSIEIRDSEISASQITISAEGTTSTSWDELGAHQDGIAGELIEQLEAIPQIGLSSVSPLSGQAKIHTALASIELTDAILNSTGTIDVQAKAVADSSLNAIAVTGLNTSGLPATVSVGFSHSTSSATIDVSGTTQINAGGFVNIATDATSTAVNVSRNEANSRASAENAPKVKTALNLALAFSNETSTVRVGESTNITSGGSVWIDAVAEVDNQASATTAIFKDGTVGFSGAIGVDKAIVTSEVHGTVSSAEEGTSRITFPGTDVFSGSHNEEIWLKGIPTNNPLKVGEKVTYHVESGAPVQLIDGADYFIHEITSTVEVDGTLEQRVRLVTAKSLDIDNRSVATDSVHSLSRLDIVRFDAANDVTTEPDTGYGQIHIPTMSVGVTEVIYLGPDSPDGEGGFPDPIDGLVQNQRYTIERVGDQIKLLNSDGAFVDFGPNTDGTHGFRIEENVQSFDPSEAVKSVGDYIELPENHGLQTGDFLLYNTDPSKAVTQEIFAFDANGNQLESLGEVTLPDAPVDGLKTNHGYYAIVDIAHPSRIRLAGSKLDALAASVVDVQSQSNSTHSFSRDAVGGIRVTATLTANNRAESGVNLSQGEQPWSAVVSGAAQGRTENIGSLGLGLFDALRGQLSSGEVTNAETRTGVQPDRKADGSQKVGTDFASSLAVAYFHHDVDAIIGNTATLTSDSGILVDADIVQLVKLGSIAESTRNALNEDSERDREFAVALAYGHYTNDAQVFIADTSTNNDGSVNIAVLDAAGEIRVDAEVIYPFLGSSTDGVNAAVTVDDFGLGSFAALLDGTHGLAGLTNVYSRTLAEGDRSPLSLAAAVAVTNTTNNVIARIGDGAELNQNEASPNQSVAVDASLDSFTIEAGHMSSFNLSVPGLAEAMNRGRKRANGKVTDFINDLVNPFGVSGKNAAGGMMLLALADHTTQAQIGGNAKITTPNDHDVTVNADSDIYNLALVQTGTGSTDFGFSAGITASDLKTDTVASIAENAIVTTGNVTVKANDVLDRVNLVGAFINGKKSGIGASVGYNRINQNAAAFIGREKTLDSLVRPSQPTIRSVGIITVKANVDGDQSSTVIAGALQGIRSGNDDEGASKTTTPTKTFGTFTLTGSVAVNDITTNVNAYLRDVNTLSRGVDIHSQNATDLSAIVVGASFAIQTASSTSSKIDLSLSGAVAINNVTSDVQALIENSHVDAYNASEQLSIKASDDSTIHADAGGFAIVVVRDSQTGVAPSAGVSVAINDVTSTVKATSTDSTLISRDTAATIVEATGNATIDALSIAGALAVRSSNIGINAAFGGAGAASQNAITQTVEATIHGGTVDAQTGDLTVRAIDTATITADGGGFAASVSIGNGTSSFSNATGVGIAINEIDGATRAKIESATSVGADDISVDSKSTAKIDAKALSVSLGIAGGRGLTAGLAGAGTGSTNVIAKPIEALITDSVVDATGEVKVDAIDTANIKTFSLGASLGGSLSNGPSGSLAVGISIAKNEIDNSVRAEVADTDATPISTINAETIIVQATDTATINASAVAATLSVSGNTGPTLSLSGGGADANNTILSDSIARVSGGSMDADTIKISSTSTSDIDAGVYGVLSGVSGSTAATGTAAIGAAVARNTVGYDSNQPDEVAVSEVLATSINASLTADKIDVLATSTSTIDSTTFVGSFAVAGSAGIGVAASGSGTLNQNLVSRNIHAMIDGSGTDGITVAGPVDVIAKDSSTILANTTSATVSVAAGGTVGGSAALGLSFSNNEIANQVQAAVKNAAAFELTGTGTDNDLTVNATQESTITSSAIAVSVAAGLSAGVGVGFSLGGADALNRINNQTDASIESSVITASGDILVDAIDTSTITSQITTVAVGAAIGGGASVSGAVGFSIARNEIGGFFENGTLVRFADQSSAVRAIVADSSVDAIGTVNVNAESTSNVNAKVFTGAIAAAGGSAAGAGSGAGVSVTNALATDVIASIEDTIDIAGSAYGIDTASVVVGATDTTTVSSLVEGVAVAAAIGANSAAISIGIATATTHASNNVQAKANRSKIRSRTGGVKVAATEGVTVDSDASATSNATALAPGFSFAIAGGGAVSDVTIGGNVSATIADSTVNTVGDVQTLANMTATGESDTFQTAVAASLIGAAAGGSVANSHISPEVTASITGTDISAGGITIDSRLQPNADALAGGLNVSTGVAVGVSKASVTLGGNVKATLDQSGATIDANSLTVRSHLEQLNESNASAQGSAGGILLGITATSAQSINQVNVNASLLQTSAGETPDQAPLVISGATMVEARREAQTGANADSVALGTIAVGVTTATGTVAGTTIATVGDNAHFNSGSLSVLANSRAVNQAGVVVGSGGGISVPVGLPSTSNTATTTAGIGDGARVNVNNELVVTSNHVSDFDTTLLAAGIGLLTGGGGNLQNEVNSTVSAVFDQGSIVTAGQITADATNRVRKAGAGLLGNVDATTGGVIAGVDVTSTTTLTLNTHVNIDGTLTAIGSLQGGGDIDLHARNVIDATDELTVRSGGVAAGGDVHSTINALVDNATVKFGGQANVYASGDLTSSARGEAGVRIQANSDTYGGATIGSGNSSATILPVNRVSVMGGAQIQADGDVNLSAGTDTQQQADRYEVRAYNDSFALSAIPITSIDAAAIVEQLNDINVASGAAISSGGELRVHTERDGSVLVTAQAKAVNWVEGVTGAINDLTGSGGVEQTIGTSASKVVGKVTVDGSLKTGIHRKQILAIDDLTYEAGNTDQASDFIVFTAPDSTIGFVQELRPLETNLDVAIKAAEENRRQYSDSPQLQAFYNEQIQRLLLEMEAQGQAERPDGAPAGTLVRTEREVLTIVVNPTLALAGAIEIRGDHFGGSGTLDAPGDALISIKNQTPAFVTISDLVIPDSVGGVVFNGQSITASGSGLVGLRNAINAENESSRDDNSAIVAFNQITGAAQTSDPEIIVENTFDPVLWNQVERPATQGNITPPGISVEGAIRNVGGDVTLATRLGETDVLSNAAITVNGTIQAKNQYILTGGTAAINAQDITDQIDPDEREDRFTSFEASGAEYARIQADISGFTGTQWLEGSFFFPTNPAFTAYLAEQPTDISLYADRIFITAEYINVNGIIQSGKEEFKLVIGQETADEIQARRSFVVPGQTVSGIHPLSTIAGQDMRAFYDYDNERIIIPETIARGGYVDLTGRITNTRNGEIRALGGYAKISVDNQTSHDIEIQGLDVSRPGEGTVVIKDRSFDTPDGAHFAIYQHRGDVVDITSSSGDSVVSSDASINYQPRSGLRYAWSVANTDTESKTTVYESSSWLGIDALAADEGSYLATGFVNPSRQTSKAVLEGVPYYYLDASNNQRYTYDAETYQRTLDLGPFGSFPLEECEDPIRWNVPSGFLGLGRTYYTEQTCTSGSTTIHDHSIKADRPIDIRFLGADEGEIDIRSNATVYVSGHLDNPTGLTRLRSPEASAGVQPGSLPGVKQLGDQGLLTARNLRISTDSQPGATFNENDEIGEPLNPLLIDLIEPTDGQPDASPTALDYGLGVFVQGNASIREVDGDLVIGGGGFNSVRNVANLTAQGSVLTAPGDFLFVNQLNLEAQTGSIGVLSENEERGFAIVAFTGDLGIDAPVISARAAGDVFFDGQANLRIQSIVTPGDVRFDMTSPYRVIDGNPEGSLDQRAIEDVIANVWADLQLTENYGANDKIDSRIATLESARTADYRTYWEMRSRQDDPSTYDPDFVVRLSEQERDFYNDDDTITTIQNSRTAQYHDLHDSVGTLTTEYDAQFVYTASQQERDDIEASTKVWTEEELNSLRPNTSLLDVSDTEFIIEAPSIQARNVIINSFAGVGSYENGTVIELPQSGETKTLSLYEQALISAAEPDDIVYLRGEPVFIDYILFGDGYLDPGPTSFDEHGFDVATGDTIYIESVNPFTEGRLIPDIEFSEFGTINYPTRGVNYLFSSSAFLSQAIVNPTEHDQATHLIIKRREDLDLDLSGNVTVFSEGNVFLGSESDLRINQINAGTQTNASHVQLKVGGSLIADQTDPSIAHLRGQRFTLEASTGAIGSAANPLRTQIIAGEHLIARADQEIVIQQAVGDFATDDFAIDQIFSRNGFVDLKTTGAIVNANASDTTNVKVGGDITLTSAMRIGDDRDAVIDYLNIDAGGAATASAPLGVALSQASGDLNVRHILARSESGSGEATRGKIHLRAAGSIIDTVDVADPLVSGSADADPIVGNPQADIVGSSVILESIDGTIGQAGNELDIDATGPLSAKSLLNSYVNQTTGDLDLGSIQSGGTVFVAAIAGGLFASQEIDSYLESQKLWLFAAGDIGTVDRPLRTNVGAIEGQSTSGSVYLDNESDIEIGNVVGASAAEGERAPQGEEASTQRFDSGFKTVGDLSLRSGGEIRVSENVTSQRDLILAATGTLTVDLGSVLEAVRQIELSGTEGSPVEMEVRGELKAPTTNANGTELNDVFDFAHSTFTGELNVFGLGGDDVITGSGLDDALFGGEGIDTIFGRGGCDVIRGGPGLDIIIASGDANCSPYGTLDMPPAVISEELPSGSVVQSVSISDLDEDDSVTYRLADDAGGLFAIIGDQLKVANAEALNERQRFTKDVVIEAVHAQGGVTRKTFTIQIEADNDAPRELRLASVESGPTFSPGDVDNGFGSLSERISGQIIVGRVQVYDPEGDATFAFESQDPRFEIIDGVLRLISGQYVESTEGTPSPSGNRINVQVKATDASDPASQVTLDVPITVGANETPWINQLSFADVDNSGEVTPNDALIVINDLAERASLPIAERDRLPFARPDSRRDHFVDTSGNGLISPDDILTVLNFLAEQHRPGSGELAQGESLASSYPASDFLPRAVDEVYSQASPAEGLVDTDMVPAKSQGYRLTGSPDTQAIALTKQSVKDSKYDEWSDQEMDSVVDVLALDLLETQV
ncbi:MAG: hypothetical protein WBD20_21345 [Pirellulaceae bacterium]